MSCQMIDNGGATSPRGFLAGAVYVGVKSHRREKPDVAILCSDRPCTCAAVFTTNKFCSASVLLGREILQGRRARGVIVNSGIANTATGAQGLENARRIGRLGEELLGLEAGELFVSSTGLIGLQLPVERILEGVRQIVPKLSKEGGHEAARAIMTTDTVPKEAAYRVELSGGSVCLGAMTKGSGMIHPNMATTLCYLTTDAAIAPEVMQPMLRLACDKSMNMTSVDGDTSTNDSMILFANGASGVTVESEEDRRRFQELLDTVCIDAARRVASDGEGASHLLLVEAVNLPSLEDARRVARAVVSSTLFKAALFGKDANWGRVMCAAGYSGASADPNRADCFLKSGAGEILVMKSGLGVEFDEELARKILSEHDVTVVIDYHAGPCSATAYGCDLTYGYVKINGDYRT